MRVLLPAVVVLSLLTGTVARAQEPEESPQLGRTVVEAYLWNTSPVALKTGLVVGAGAELRRSVGEGGLFVGARLAVGGTTEYGAEWVLEHIHTVAGAQVGFAKALGAAQLWGQLGAGVLVIRQLGQRAQYERLSAAGITNLRRDGWAAGPYLSGELGVGVVFTGAWLLRVHLGPAFTVVTVAGVSTPHWVLESGLGVGRAF
jgi:hypothetical protein